MLTRGDRFGAYEVIGSLGAGGMGEVYRARDLKLQREVALKILPDAFAGDPDRLARFGREAQVLASLSHSAIGAIYGLEETDGRKALVLELVEGPTLADLLVKGPMKGADALRLARQMAAALEVAHGKGIIHRDLKPGNVKVTTGTVKVLDFGLAKIRDGRPARTDTSNSPTISMPGTILGTAAYMSPEQAKGEEIERTADVWAFGCVLYEMLAGKAAFRGGSVSEIVSEVLKSEPEWGRLPSDTPASIRRLLRRCLRKDPHERLQHIGDARIEIDDTLNDPEAATPLVVRPSLREQIAWAALALVTLSAVAAFVWLPRSALPGAASPEMRLELNTPPTTDVTSLAISPDGQKIVFAGDGQGGPRLWARALGSISSQPLPGTERGQFPFWSPDSKAIGFFADGKLKRLDIDTSAVQSLTDAIAGRGGTWNADDVILFAPNATGRLWRVSASGGEPAQVTQGGDRGNDRFPVFLPDGNHFIFYVQGAASGVYLGDLAGSAPRRLVEADATAVFRGPSDLLFVRQRTLFAQTLDPARLALVGNPTPLAENVALAGSTGHSALSASAAGTIVFRTGSAGGRRQFVWLDRSGGEIGKVGERDSGGPTNPSMSPDGRRVAMLRTTNGNVDVWLLDIVRGVLSRFTSDAANDVNPAWSPDGAQIAFQSNRTGVSDLYLKSASGAGGDQVLLSTPEDKAPSDWSRDGGFLLYRNTGPKTGYDLWALPMTGDRKQFSVVQTEFEERDGQFSPDGKWVAYQSNESGRFEIYVRPFPGPGGTWQVSTNGGAQVRWRPDGKEIFYVATMDEKLMAVPIAFTGNQPEIGKPTALFTTRLGGAVQGLFKQQYMVSADGRSFLVNAVADEAASPISLILNWKSGS
ncbi:MAG TPA: protein kinase [Gemmatimonadales bacterium]|nr:protein kinase [Gemmatimonadales bacterium]